VIQGRGAARPATALPTTFRRRFKGASAGYLLIAPAIVVSVVFLLIPMVVSAYWSLTHYNGIQAPEFVGLQNYQEVLSNPRFQRSFQNTVFFVVVGMSFGPLLGLGSALLLNTRLRLRSFYRTAFFLPTMTSLVVVATIWKFMYADNGIINSVAALFGLPGHDWLNDPTTALPAVVATAIWQGFGFETVVFLAALQAVPREHYEAATVDGAGRWATFRWITLPALRPTIVFVYVIGIIGSFQTFDQVFVMTNGGPISATRTVVFDLVDRFNKLDIGGASAVAYILLIVLAFVSYLQLRLGDRGN
jgi:ABC-type sugar transport system permease subunit